MWKRHYVPRGQHAIGADLMSPRKRAGASRKLRRRKRSSGYVKPSGNWKRDRVKIEFVFGNALMTGYVKSRNRAQVETIFKNHERYCKEKGRAFDLGSICSEKILETTPLEIVAENIRQYFLHHAQIDLLTWKAPK